MRLLDTSAWIEWLIGPSAAEAIIYASARAHGADVLTCDKPFEGLPGVVLVEKIKDCPVLPT